MFEMVIAIKKECSIESREELRTYIHLSVYGVQRNNTCKLAQDISFMEKREEEIVLSSLNVFVFDENPTRFIYD